MMTLEKSWLGEWSFKDDVIGEVKLFGRLIYSPTDKFILEASVEHLPFNIMFDLQRLSKIDYIVGLDYKTQTNLTLISSIISGINYSSNGGNTLIIIPNLLIEGLYYDIEDSLLFNAISIKYSGLNQWMRSLKKVETSFEDKSETLIMRYNKSKNINFQVNEFLNFSVHFTYSFKQEDSEETGFFLKEDINIIFKSRNSRLNFNEYSKQSEHLRRLLQILYYQPVFVLNSHVELNENKTMYPLYYNQVHGKFFSNYITHLGYLINFNDIVDFPKLLVNWFELRKSDDYTYVTWVASKHLTINTPFSEEVFLENIRALEVYHKAKYPQITKRQEKKIYLKNRVEHLLSIVQNSVDLKEFHLVFQNENNFIETIVSNRNYLTHYGEDSVNLNDLLTIGQLYSFTNKARILLLTLLLSDIGIDSKKTFKRLFSIHTQS